MSLQCLSFSQEWDTPFFKVLANNDTCAAAGHQGGIVIPKDLRRFFPVLAEGSTSSINPTTDQRITAELFEENRFLATVSTRYQLQTWGGTRSAESRLTDQLLPLRERARGGDLLFIQRSKVGIGQYRLTLVRKSSSNFRGAEDASNGKRWGTVRTISR